MMLNYLITMIGVTGVIAIAANFILEATNKLEKNHHTFAWLNLFGSSALLIYSLYFYVWLFVALNTFLVVVGLIGLRKVYRK